MSSWHRWPFQRTTPACGAVAFTGTGFIRPGPAELATEDQATRRPGGSGRHMWKDPGRYERSES
jgi:hypothetical protein